MIIFLWLFTGKDDLDSNGSGYEYSTEFPDQYHETNAIIWGA